MNKLIGISALIFSLSIAYYFVVYLPNKNQENFDREMSLRQATIQARSECVLAVEQSYSTQWNNTCRIRGLSTNCSLDTPTVNSINNIRQENKDTCFKLYPSN